MSNEPTSDRGKETTMRAIFISYRREDAEGQAGRLFDDLSREFGEKSAFMDVAGIEAGRDFRRVIDSHVASCGVLLAVIGKGWIDAKDESDRRRLDDPMDFVRLETASALKRDIPVIPVLVQGARMPRAEQLPADLADLAYRNAVELTHARWDSDVQLLIKALRPHVESKQAARSPRESSVAGSDTVATAVTPETPGEQGAAPAVAQRPARKSLVAIAAGLVATVAVMGGGYAWYQKSSQTTQLARKAESLEEARNAAANELAAVKQQAEEKAAADELARRQAQDKAAADELARRRAQEKAAADELAARRQAKETAADE